jgi:hypothetical protein
MVATEVFLEVGAPHCRELEVRVVDSAQLVSRVALRVFDDVGDEP